MKECVDESSSTTNVYFVHKDPVTDLCAHNFDREAITNFLVNHSHCPISRKPLRTSDLISNHSLAEKVERWSFQREHEGLIHQLTEEEVTSVYSDEEESANLDSQMEKGIPRKKRLGVHKKNVLYSEVPAELMLLPQERQMLARVRTKAAESRSLRRKRRCYRITWAFFGVIIICTLALIAWRSLRTDQKEMGS